MDSFSPFDPVHEELISFLKSKVSGTGIQVPAGVVYDGTKSAYRCPPWSLREELGLTGSDPEFFCYFSEPETYDGDRSKCRPGETSYWKTTEPPFGVLNGGRVVGIVEILTYYHFHEPTESVMFEYRLVHDQDLANAPKDDGLVLCKIFCKHGVPTFSYNYQPSLTYSDPTLFKGLYDYRLEPTFFKSVADHHEEKVYTIFMQTIDPVQRHLLLKKHNVSYGIVEFGWWPSGCFIRLKLSSVQAFGLADEEGVVVLHDGWPISRSCDRTGCQYVVL